MTPRVGAEFERVSASVPTAGAPFFAFFFGRAKKNVPVCAARAHKNHIW